MQNDSPSGANPLLAVIANITPLKGEQWQVAWADAEKAVIALESEPNFESYIRVSISRYPSWLNTIMLSALAVIAMGALWISAGKQIAATELVLGSVVQHSAGRVSTFWLDMSLLVALVVGEVGALAFSLAVAIFGKRGRTTIVLFRIASIVCTGFALGGNATLTLRYPDATAPVFQWFLTLAMPLLVLGVGYVGEMFLLDILEHRLTARNKYEQDKAQYDFYQKTPSAHPMFKKVFHGNVKDQLLEAQNFQRKKLLHGLISESPQAVKLLIQREYARNEFSLVWDEDDANPTSPSSEGQSPPENSLIVSSSN
jgi:hypothetical protein